MHTCCHVPSHLSQQAFISVDVGAASTCWWWSMLPPAMCLTSRCMHWNAHMLSCAKPSFTAGVHLSGCRGCEHMLVVVYATTSHVLDQPLHALECTHAVLWFVLPNHNFFVVFFFF